MEIINRRKRSLLITALVLASICSTPVFSLRSQDSSTYTKILFAGNPVISVGGGLAITSDVGESQNFPIVDSTTDEFYNYTANTSTQTNGFYDIFLGKESPFLSSWLWQLGIDFSQITTLNAKGALSQGIDITSANTYSYQYSLLSRQLLVEGKWLYPAQHGIYPYLLLGLGVAFNRAYAYGTNVPLFSTFTRLYNDHTQTTFSYAAGVGLDYAFASQWRLGIGYRFADLGKVNLGPAIINTTQVSGTLTQNHLYINEILAQLTWII